MILFIFQGMYIVALLAGAYLTFKRRNWRMLGVFSLFLLGALINIAIPFLFQDADDVYPLRAFMYLHSLRYVLYLTAILILIHMTMKKSSG